MTTKSFIRSRWFEDIPVGEFHVLGSHIFSEKEIIKFGKKYAPEVYHTDPEMAYGSIHRGLIASGWHVNAVWMKMMVSYMERFARGVQDGRRNGAGLVVHHLEWQRPVRPGHELTYTYEVIEKPDKIIRERWGIIRSRNEAFNQYHQVVMSFTIDILAERNPELL